MLVLLLIGIFALSRSPFLSGKGSFSDAGLFQFSLLSSAHMHAPPLKFKYLIFSMCACTCKYYLDKILIIVAIE